MLRSWSSLLPSLSAALSVGLLLVVTAAGCASPGVNIVTLRPTAALEPRGADRLVLVDGEGRRAGKEDVADLFRELARGGFYSVDDRGDDGVKLTLVGDKGNIEGSSKAPKSNELYVRVDVLNWEAAPAIFKDKAEDGVTDVDVPGVHGRADLQISVVTAAGEVLMRERPYNGGADLVDDCAPGTPVMTATCANVLIKKSIDAAGRAALTAFLIDITPVRVTDYVKYDDGDPGQKKLLEKANDQPLSSTEKALRRYIKKNPNNAIALYNLAVTEDAQGQFEDAIAHYDAAMNIVTRDGYVQARGDAKARLVAWERVYGPRAKAKQAKAEVASAETAKEPTKEPTKETAPPAP